MVSRGRASPRLRWFVLGACCWLAGCAGQQLGARELQASYAAATLDELRATPPGDDTLAAAKLADRRGAEEFAAQLAIDTVHAAQLDAAIADLREDAATQRSAQRRWRKHARIARAVVARTRAPQAMLDAVRSSPHPARHARALRRAVRDSFTLPWGIEELGRWTRRPALQVEILRRDGPTGPLAWLTAFERLPRRLQRDATLLDTALRNTVVLARPRAEIVARARALLELDRWNLPARLVVAVDREIAAGRLRVDPWLWPDLLLSVGFGPSVVVRAQQRLAHTEHPLWRLALAHTLLRAGLIGDAQAVVAGAQRSGRERESLELVDALVQLGSGRATAFERWRGQHDEPSPYTDHQVAALDREARRDPGVRELAAAARRREVANRDRPRADNEALLRTALDDDASARLRRRARDELRANPRIGRIEAQCRRDRLDADACMELVNVQLWSPSGERSDALPVLAAADALEAYAWQSADAPPLHWLDHGREQGTRDRLLAAIFAADRHGDRAGARRLLERDGALLPITARVDLTLMLDDEESLLTSEESLPTLDELVAGWSPEEEPGRGRRGALLTALLQISAGEPCAAMPALRELGSGQRGAVAAWLAVYGAWAALECGDDAAATWFIARVQTGAPGAAASYALRGEQLVRHEQLDEAARWFIAALARDPNLALAFAGLERWAERSSDARRLRRLLAAAPDDWRYQHDALLRANARGTVTARADLVAVRAIEDREGVARAEQLLELEPDLADTVLGALDEQLAAADDAEQRRGLATRMVAILTRLAHDPEVDLLYWQHRAEGLAFLLGRKPLALPRRGGPRSPYDPVEMLLRARAKRAIDDQQALLLWRSRWRWESEDVAAQELLTRIVTAPWSPELGAFACDVLVVLEHWKDALPICRDAWKWSASPALAGHTARAALGDNTAIDAKVLAEVFASEPPRFPLARDGQAGMWWAARAREHQLHGRDDAAAAAWIEALALDTGPTEDDWAQLPGRGLSIRSAELSQPIDGAKWARQAFLALLGGELEVARGYARAAVAISGGAPREQRHRAAHRLAFVELAAADVAAGELDRAGVIEGTLLVFTEVEPARYEAFFAAHPRSRVARVAEAERALGSDDLARARTAVAAMVEIDASQPLVAVTAIRTAVASGELPRARALYLAARAHGDHPVLDTVIVPEAVRGPEPGVPAWLRDRELVRERMAAARDDEPVRYTRRVLLEQELEVWAPERWTAADDNPLMLTAPEGWSMVLEPRSRASRCAGPQCAEQLRAELEATGATVLWSAPLDTGAGPATELVSVFGDDAMMITVVPRGGRELRLIAHAPLEHIEHALAALRVARDSFGPLDGVIGGFRAESLRRSAVALDDATRLRIRAALAHPVSARGCPIALVLAELGSDAARDSALVDAWLVTHTEQQRLALTECASAEASAAGGIAVLALLDDDTRVHAWGRAAVQAHPERARTSARTLFTSALEPALAHPDHLRRRDLPPRGVLELVAALPLRHAEAMVAELIASPAERERALGFAAAGIRRELLSRARALELVRTGDVRSAALAIDYLLEELEPAELTAIRARVDALRPNDQPERELLVEACGALAEAGDPEDAARLRRAASRVVVTADASEELRLTRRVLDVIAKLHGRERQRRQNIAEPSTLRTPESLGGSELAGLLPGHDWFYAKVSNPRLVWSSARAALARLSSGSAANRQMVGEVVKSLLARAGTGLFADDAGLDLSRGIECATNPKISAGEVCTAWVTDRDRVLGLLAERDFGEDDGLVLPLHVAQGFAKAPRFLSALPLIMPGMLVTEDAAPERTIAFEERVRGEIELGPHRLYSSLIVRGHPGEIDIDEEYYLFVGDRMFAFTTRRLANAVLGGSGAMLADDPEFVALAERLHGEAGIVGAGLGDAAEGNASSIELAVDERGLRFRQLVRSEEPIGDAAQVIDRLPAGAAATWSVGSGAPREELEGSTRPGTDEGAAPPPELSRTRGSVAFGWYPLPGEGLWHDWVIALAPTADDRRALARAKLLPRKLGTVRAGVHAGAQGELVIYASSRALLDRALQPPAAGNHAQARTFAGGSFRGAPSSAAVNAARSGDPSFRRFLALGLEVVDSAEYQANDEAGAGLLVVAGRITLALVADDRPSDVVDAWLAAHDDSNSILLPRRLQPRDLAAELTYVLEVVEPESFVQRVLARSPRIAAELASTPTGPPRVRVTVSPSAADRELALTTAERKRALAATRDYPTDAASIRELLPVIVGDERDPAKIAARVVAWVHKRIRYEITPRRLDGAKVLESGRGDCSEYATLTVTLLRAAGVPAQERSGMMASGTDMTAHAWAAYHDGKRWHEVDPTAGTTFVTAGHIEMSVIDVLALDAVGGLQVLAIE